MSNREIQPEIHEIQLTSKKIIQIFSEMRSQIGHINEWSNLNKMIVSFLTPELCDLSSVLWLNNDKQFQIEESKSNDHFFFNIEFDDLSEIYDKVLQSNKSEFRVFNQLFVMVCPFFFEEEVSGVVLTATHINRIKNQSDHFLYIDEIIKFSKSYIEKQNLFRQLKLARLKLKNKPNPF